MNWQKKSVPRKSKGWGYVSTVSSKTHTEHSDPKINLRWNSTISGMKICNLLLFPAYISYNFRVGSLSRIKKKIKYFSWYVRNELLNKQNKWSLKTLNWFESGSVISGFGSPSSKICIFIGSSGVSLDLEQCNWEKIYLLKEQYLTFLLYTCIISLGQLMTAGDDDQ